MLGTWQVVVVAVVIVLLFGRGRISGVMSELGSGIRSFRKGLASADSVGEQRGSVMSHEAGAGRVTGVDRNAEYKDDCGMSGSSPDKG